MFFGIAQFFIHGIVTNIKLRAIYNPGLAAVVFLHIPIGIYYIGYVAANHLASTWDWAGGVVLTIATAGLIVNGCTYHLLANRNSPFPFDAD